MSLGFVRIPIPKDHWKAISLESLRGKICYENHPSQSAKGYIAQICFDRWIWNSRPFSQFFTTLLRKKMGLTQLVARIVGIFFLWNFINNNVVESHPLEMARSCSFSVGTMDDLITAIGQTDNLAYILWPGTTQIAPVHVEYALQVPSPPMGLGMTSSPTLFFVDPHKMTLIPITIQPFQSNLWQGA